MCSAPFCFYPDGADVPRLRSQPCVPTPTQRDAALQVSLFSSVSGPGNASLCFLWLCAIPDPRVFSLMALQALRVCPSSEQGRTRMGAQLWAQLWTWARGSEMCAPVARPVTCRPAREREPVCAPARCLMAPGAFSRAGPVLGLVADALAFASQLRFSPWF